MAGGAVLQPALMVGAMVAVITTALTRTVGADGGLTRPAHLGRTVTALALLSAALAAWYGADSGAAMAASIGGLPFGAPRDRAGSAAARAGMPSDLLAAGGLSVERANLFRARMPALFRSAQYARGSGGVRQFRLPTERGTPLVVLDPEASWMLLGPELADLPGRMLAFVWRDPRFAPSGTLVMFSETFADLRARTKTGGVDEAWWEDLSRTLSQGMSPEQAAALIDRLPLDIRLKLSLTEVAPMTRAGSVSWLAQRWGVTTAQVISAVAASPLLDASSDGLVVAAHPRMRVWTRPAPGRAVVARFRSLLDDTTTEFPNLEPDDWSDEKEIADEVGAAPLRVGTAEAAALLAEGGLFKWALRPDGSLWIGRPYTQVGDHLVEITHAVLAAGGPVLAAGEIFTVPGFRRAAGIDVLSGHYHQGNDEWDNVSGLALGRAAFERHGIRIAFDILFEGDEVAFPPAPPAAGDDADGLRLHPLVVLGGLVAALQAVPAAAGTVVGAVLATAAGGIALWGAARLAAWVTAGKAAARGARARGGGRPRPRL
jgi:hypothetical protein